DRMRLTVLLSGLFLSTYFMSPAAAQDTNSHAEMQPSAETNAETPPIDQPTKPSAETIYDSLGHSGQFGLSAGVSTGWLVRILYDTAKTTCNTDDPDNPVCTSGAPVIFGAEVSYAVSDGVELALPFQLTLTDLDGHKPVSAGILMRFLPLDAGLANLFFEIGLPLLLAPKVDVGMHLGTGLALDFERHFGIRLGVYPSAFFSDELRTTFNFGLALQGRL
ncbi:MAG: hypothetical protein CO108_13850, partial [Deltaproteobacteria bacterium CG_4_9_14_3_um_filter_63_12]